MDAFDDVDDKPQVPPPSMSYMPTIIRIRIITLITAGHLVITAIRALARPPYSMYLRTTHPASYPLGRGGGNLHLSSLHFSVSFLAIGLRDAYAKSPTIGLPSSTLTYHGSAFEPISTRASPSPQGFDVRLIVPLQSLH